MTARLAAAWAAYLEREGPFTGSALHEPEAQVATKRAFFAGAQAYDRLIFMAPAGADQRECYLTKLDCELAEFAQEVTGGKA